MSVQPQGGRLDRASGTRTRRRSEDRGAALVEFAFILPVLACLILGLFTGGVAYSRSISMNNAAREAARYGASLTDGGTNQWLTDVANAAQQAASGDLKAGVPDLRICVAYAHPGASGTEQVSRRLIRTNTAPDDIANGDCPGVETPPLRPATEQRVQVFVERTSNLEAFFFTKTLTLTRSALTRYER